ncbi:hypothetical protein ACFFHH_17305 [Cytobacillus solani]|uniref:hypothetical protein n=1 Tax=Cytobacillus solani TaxID=1637975 RepID=UPI000ADE75F6|nr:hypothetical protein [Cytobacillus solani]USK56769.1 hypothetical protein LIS82_09970 [Cytobacillus solani]
MKKVFGFILLVLIFIFLLTGQFDRALTVCYAAIVIANTYQAIEFFQKKNENRPLST